MTHADHLRAAPAFRQPTTGFLKRFFLAIQRADERYRQKQKLLGTPPSQLADMGISPEMVNDLFRRS